MKLIFRINDVLAIKIAAASCSCLCIRELHRSPQFSYVISRYYKDSLMKLRISDAIDCTCTAGGWSRELNSAIRERAGREGRRGGGVGVRRGWSMLSRSNTGEKDRASEWMNGFQSVPSLCWSGSCRVCKSTPASPLCPLSPDPLVTPADPTHRAHASHLSTMDRRFHSPLVLLSRV